MYFFVTKDSNKLLKILIQYLWYTEFTNFGLLRIYNWGLIECKNVYLIKSILYSNSELYFS